MTAEWDDLARLAQAAQELTPGEWVAGDGWVYTPPVYDDDNRLASVLGMKYADRDRANAEHARAQRNAEFIAAANPATILRLIAENRRLTHLLGSHADGHRCTCTMTRPAQFTHEYGPEPAEWEQDPWCPTHPDVDQIRSEFDALAARLAVVEALLADGPDTWRPYQVREAGDVFMADEVTEFTADLRAVLSAAPTDTTKETS